MKQPISKSTQPCSVTHVRETPLFNFDCENMHPISLALVPAPSYNHLSRSKMRIILRDNRTPHRNIQCCPSIHHLAKLDIKPEPRSKTKIFATQCCWKHLALWSKRDAKVILNLSDHGECGLFLSSPSKLDRDDHPTPNYSTNQKR